MRIKLAVFLMFFLVLFSQFSYAETVSLEPKGALPQATQESAAFKKAQRDARRMLNWWKYKLKNDPELQNFQPPQIPQARLPQYSIEEERRTPEKK